MQEYPTEKGKKYYLTVKSVPCTVSFKGKNDLLYIIGSYANTGQYSFISPYYRLLVDKDDAILTPKEIC